MSDRWTRGDKIGFAGVLVGVLSLIAAFAVVPEVRRSFRLDSAPTADAPPVNQNSALPSGRVEGTVTSTASSGRLESTPDNSDKNSKHAERRTSRRLPSDAAVEHSTDRSSTDSVQTAAPSDYATSFAYGMSEWAFHRFGSWSETAKWTLVNDSGIALELAGGVHWGGGNYIAVVPQTVRTDGRVSVRIKIADVRNDGHHSGLIARFQNIDNFYELFLNRPSRSLHLSKWVAGQERRLTSVELPAYVFEQWVTLELHCDGDELVGLIDGRKVLTARDGALTKGAFGVFNAGGATRFQNFAVSNGTA